MKRPAIVNWPLYIFDLDGTLALNEHRQHFVKGPKQHWGDFFAACEHDEPNLPVIRTMERLWSGGADIRIFSGRSDEVKKQTLAWLYEHTALGDDYLKGCLRMREEGDFTPDEELKLSWFQALSEDDRKSLVAVFDDRDKVVAMWRSVGVACFQVAPGAF